MMTTEHGGTFTVNMSREEWMILAMAIGTASCTYESNYVRHLNMMKPNMTEDSKMYEKDQATFYRERINELTELWNKMHHVKHV